VTGAPFIFGKVPARGDFVRAGRIGPLVDDLDGWLQRALLALRAPAPAGGPIAFVFGRPGGTLAGAFVPSHDRSGRAFPLVAGAAAEGAPALDGAAVSAAGPLVLAAADAAMAIVAGLPLDEALESLRLAPAAGVAAGAGQAGHSDAIAARLADALGPFRQSQAPRYGLALAVPAEPGARAAGAGYWLDRTLAGTPRRSSMSVIWGAGAAPARAAIFAGPPTADALSYFLTGAAVDGVYDVDAGLEAQHAPDTD